MRGVTCVVTLTPARPRESPVGHATTTRHQGRGGQGIGICRPLPVHRDLKILSRLGVPKANSVNRTKNTVAELTDDERDKLKLLCYNFKYQLQPFERQEIAGILVTLDNSARGNRGEGQTST